jgi:Tfp pilus assembly protein PilO
MERLQQYRIPLFTVVGALIVVVVVYLAWLSPEGSKLSTLQAKQTQLQTQQTGLQAEISTLEHEKSELPTTCAALTNDVTEVPGAPDVDSFLQQVTQLAVQSGDPNTPSISVTQATGSTQAVSGATPVAVDFSLAGTYGQMSAFLQGLYSFPRLFTISSVTIGGGTNAVAASAAPAAGTMGYTLSLTGNIYYSTGQADACTASK